MEKKQMSLDLPFFSPKKPVKEIKKPVKKIESTPVPPKLKEKPIAGPIPATGSQEPEQMPSDFTLSKGDQYHQVNNNLIYYCRNCQKHLKNPLYYTVRLNENHTERIEVCTYCHGVELNTTCRESTDEENTCLKCGEGLDGGICYNCNRDLALERMKAAEKEKHEGMKRIPFTDKWVKEEEYNKIG